MLWSQTAQSTSDAKGPQQGGCSENWGISVKKSRKIFFIEFGEAQCSTKPMVAGEFRPEIDV